MTQERRALVVDSDPDSCDLIRETLTADGFVVRVTENAETALASLQDEPVDLVFAASSLPGR